MTQPVSITKTNRSTLYRETVAVYFGVNTEHNNEAWGRNVVKIELAIYRVATFNRTNSE